MRFLPCKEIRAILQPTFYPCFAFKGNCESMRWLPQVGHVPRGFLGATGKRNEVELVLIVAEPGNPYSATPGEHYGTEHFRPGSSPEELLRGVCRFTYTCFRDHTDPFHANVRSILDACWPKLSFDERLRHTWITESVLCSAKGGAGTNVPAIVERTCGEDYLKQQLELFPKATIAALGGKAQARLRRLGVKRPFLCCGSVAPPGCWQPKVRHSWRQICRAVHATKYR